MKLARNLFATASLAAALGLVLVATAAAPAAAAETVYVHDAHPDGWSIGLGLGDPSGLDVKYWHNDVSGFDFGMGFARFDKVFSMYAEYELGLVDIRMGRGNHGVFYLGFGGEAALRDHAPKASFYGGTPIGFTMRFRAPWDLYAEFRPQVHFHEDPDFVFGGQVGARYVF
ncbi:MAG: hypothetical protein KC635_12795 [Myxococcales bacterium]|nr:hypothetical protein [Myxococcales bacterium]MCB9733216.1 hypothetical protein [Deltaproteobacteria bacterium]